MDTTAYYRATQQSDQLLRERQAQINAALSDGTITAAQAADLRIKALEIHLASCGKARRAHLEPQP